MPTLKEIEERLKSYVARDGNGDGALNPGTPLAEVKREAAVLILLTPRDDGSITVLFTERTKTLHAHAGQVSFPGGGVDPSDKNATDTALREAEEEIGLDRSNARVLGTLSDYVTRTGFLVTPVVAVLEKQQDWLPQETEVARIFEVPLETIARNLKEESLTFEGGERRFYGMTFDGAHIWGATAGMLHDFLAAVQDPPANNNAVSNNAGNAGGRKNDPPAALK